MHYGYAILLNEEGCLVPGPTQGTRQRKYGWCACHWPFQSPEKSERVSWSRHMAIDDERTGWNIRVQTGCTAFNSLWECLIRFKANRVLKGGDDQKTLLGCKG